jgi:heavy metal sensor kinase
VNISLRAQLAAWHTTVLAILLISFAGAAYGFVSYTTRERIDSALGDAADDLATELAAERQKQRTTAAATGEVLSELQSRSIAFAVYGVSGQLIESRQPRARRASTAETPERALDLAALGRLLHARPTTRRSFLTVRDSKGGYRAALVPVRLPDGFFLAAAAQSLHDEAELLHNARLAMLVAIPAALLLSWAGGTVLARRSLAPMVAMRDNAARITASNLGDRLPVARPGDEVGELASVINDLLGRLERSFAQQRQFMADASHELRTPVAIIQNESSFAVSRRRDAAEYEEAFGVVLTASRRLRRIVDDLFMLARADAGELPVRRDPVYLDDIVAECAREVRLLADARGVDVVVEPLPETPLVGDEVLLTRLVLNLLDNAIKYSHTGARVTVRLAGHGDECLLTVADTGPGIPQELQPRIFDRFVRADKARAHTDDALTSGAGLGLSIARWVAEAHGGSLSLAHSDETGSIFELRLPIEAPAPRLLRSV